MGIFRDWLKDYGREMAVWVRGAALAVTPEPITLVVLWRDRLLISHLDAILAEFHKSFGGELDTVIVHPESLDVAALCEKVAVHRCNSRCCTEACA